MSAIHGKGWGDKHDWICVGQPPMRVTHYKCLGCGAIFSHHYNSIPNIFEAMEAEGVSDGCPSNPS